MLESLRFFAVFLTPHRIGENNENSHCEEGIVAKKSPHKHRPKSIPRKRGKNGVKELSAAPEFPGVGMKEMAAYINTHSEKS